jgi:hypothetical protein
MNDISEMHITVRMEFISPTFWVIHLAIISFHEQLSSYTLLEIYIFD